jgi:hypothetical protein
MLLRAWWRGRPGDVRLAYAAVGCFAAWAAMSVASGPELLVVMSAWVVVPLMVIVTLVVAGRMLIAPRRIARILPLVLASGCVAVVLVAPPGAAVDLHLIARVYLAGGPDAVNEWGQRLIRGQQGNSESGIVELDLLPAGVRNHLSGHVVVGRTIWSDLPRARIELGGGFFHYGVVVYPTRTGPPVRGWQQTLGWPSEVVIYHDE